MGAKAKAAIQAAETASTPMNTAGDALQQEFMRLAAQEATHEALLGDIVGRCAAVHPGVQDISTVLAGDQELTRMVTTKGKSDETLTKIKVGLKASLLLLEQKLAAARTATTGLQTLILAKEKKQNSAGKNPLAIVKAKLGTKSLSSLKTEKGKIDGAIGSVVDRTLATKMYVEKVL